MHIVLISPIYVSKFVTKYDFCWLICGKPQTQIDTYFYEFLDARCDMVICEILLLSQFDSIYSMPMPVNVQ